MELILIKNLGEWNPQLFRELKGHLKRRNLFFTIASSFACQFLLFTTFWDQRFQWEFISRTLNWILPLFLLVGGVHLLISDLEKEARRGTLNFIRLSPQSSQSILLGKLLGVPALLYLAIALAIPLHWLSAYTAGVPLVWLVGLYALWGVSCWFFYSFAFYYTLVWSALGESKALAWMGSLFACFVGVPYIGLVDFYFSFYQSGSGFGNWHWFWLPVGDQPNLILLWGLISLSVGAYWIWQAAIRLFTNPNTTALSKGQSYWLVASVQFWLLGFALQPLNSVSANVQVSIGCAILFFLNPVGFLMLIGILSPQRQMLQEWARYRHQNRFSGQGVFHRSLIKDLIWGEKSPALVAIAINFLISAAIWIPWIVLELGSNEARGNFTTLTALLGLLVTINAILIYAAIAQVMLFMTRWKQTLWTVGTVGILVGVPLTLVATFGINPLQMTFLLLLSPLPIVALINSSTITIFLGLLAQLSILGVITLQMTRQLRKVGESTTKTLLAEPSSRYP